MSKAVERLGIRSPQDFEKELTRVIEEQLKKSLDLALTYKTETCETTSDTIVKKNVIQKKRVSETSINVKVTVSCTVPDNEPIFRPSLEAFKHILNNIREIIPKECYDYFIDHFAAGLKNSKIIDTHIRDTIKSQKPGTTANFAVTYPEQLVKTMQEGDNSHIALHVRRLMMVTPLIYVAYRRAPSAHEALSKNAFDTARIQMINHHSEVLRKIDGVGSRLSKDGRNTEERIEGLKEADAQSFARHLFHQLSQKKINMLYDPEAILDDKVVPGFVAKIKELYKEDKNLEKHIPTIIRKFQIHFIRVSRSHYELYKAFYECPFFNDGKQHHAKSFISPSYTDEDLPKVSSSESISTPRQTSCPMLHASQPYVPSRETTAIPLSTVHNPNIESSRSALATHHVSGEPIQRTRAVSFGSSRHSLKHSPTCYTGLAADGRGALKTLSSEDINHLQPGS